MTGAHRAMITKLVSRVRELEDENGSLELQTEDLQGELASATSLASDATARDVFIFLRRELSSWARSDWLELGRLIAQHSTSEL